VSIVPRLEVYYSRHSSSARLCKLRREKDGRFNGEEMVKAAENTVMVVFELPRHEMVAAS
jgi:hypothetical protein